MMNTMMMTRMMAEDCGAPELRTFCDRKTSYGKRSGLKRWFLKLLGK